MSDNTPFLKQCEILAEFLETKKDETRFTDFVGYNDLGLPLALAIHRGQAEASEVNEELVDETFEMLLAVLDIEDTGFNGLEEMIIASEDQQDDD